MWAKSEYRGCTGVVTGMTENRKYLLLKFKSGRRAGTELYFALDEIESQYKGASQ